MTAVTESKEDLYFDNQKYRPEITPVGGNIGWNVSKLATDQDTLEKRVVLLTSNDKSSTYHIDASIQAKVPSDLFRQRMADYWKSQKSSSLTAAWISAMATGAGIGATFVFSANPAAPTVSAIASFILGGLAIRQLYLTNQASRQSNGWNISPTETLAAKRKEAYEKGFLHVYQNNLKLVEKSNTAILLPSEVEHLFEEYFTQFSDRLLGETCTTEQQKKRWLDSFTSYNPISTNLLMYGYGRIPESLQFITKDYEALAKILKDLRKEFAELKSARRAETDKIIVDLNQQRNTALLPFKLMLAHWESEALKDRDAKLDKLPASKAKEREKVEQEYRDKLSSYKTYYIAAATPVDMYYDGYVKNAKEKLTEIIDTISKNETSALATYFKRAREILQNGVDIKNNRYSYQPQPVDLAGVFHIPPVPSVLPQKVPDFRDQALHINISVSPQQYPAGFNPQDPAYQQFVNWRP